MVFCGSCGHQNEDFAKFCEGCGEALEFEQVEEIVEEKDVLDAGDFGGEEIVEEIVEEVVVEEPTVEEVVVEEPLTDQQVEEKVIEEEISNNLAETSVSEGAVLHSVKRTGVKGKTVGPAKWENAKEVGELIAKVLHAGSFSGWILCGYQDDNCTLEIQAHGTGGVSEFVPLLQDDQWQYMLVRTQDTSKNIKMQGEVKKTTRDVFITWQGPSVSILQRGRFNEHRNTLRSVMKPSHADLVAIGKKNFTEQEVASKSAPLSGSHEIS